LNQQQRKLKHKRIWLKWRETRYLALTPFIKYNLFGLGVFEICFGPKKKHKSIVSSKQCLYVYEQTECMKGCVGLVGLFDVI
jgi:hypothetical protein